MPKRADIKKIVTTKVGALALVYGLLVALGTTAASSFAQTRSLDDSIVVPIMCGRLTDSEFTSTPLSSSYLLGPGRPRKADVFLYRRKGQKKCCGKEAFVAEVSTGSDGMFEFKGAV